MAEPGHPPLWSSHALCESQFFHAPASCRQLPSPGTFLPTLLNFRIFKCGFRGHFFLTLSLALSLDPYNPQHFSRYLYHLSLIPTSPKEVRPEGRGQGLLLSVCPGSGRGSLGKPRAAGGWD